MSAPARYEWTCPVMRVLGVDPGSTHSALVIIDTTTRRPLTRELYANHTLATVLTEIREERSVDQAVIEMVESYGMPVGRSVFHTCVWIGRFTEALAPHDYAAATGGVPVTLQGRLPVKLHHCGAANARDSHVTQALIDRFADGAPNRGKGTKANPGWFYGFKADIWAAYALAVYAADVMEGVA